MSKPGFNFKDLDPGVREALEPYCDRVTIESGSKHVKVRLDGRLVCVVSRSVHNAPRKQANAAATVRRWLRRFGL